jgi:hypothetical protein
MLLRGTADVRSDAATVPYRRIDTSELGFSADQRSAFHSHKGQRDRMTGEIDARVPSKRPKKVRGRYGAKKMFIGRHLETIADVDPG